MGDLSDGSFVPDMWSNEVLRTFSDGRWDNWAECTSQVALRMTDGEVVVPGDPYMMRNKWRGSKMVGTEMYGKVSWVARTLDDNNFLGKK